MKVLVSRDEITKYTTVEISDVDFSQFRPNFYRISLKDKKIKTIPAQWTYITECKDNMYFTFQDCSYSTLAVERQNLDNKNFFLHLYCTWEGNKKKFTISTLPKFNEDDSFEYIKKFFEILSSLDMNKFKKQLDTH